MSGRACLLDEVQHLWSSALQSVLSEVVTLTCEESHVLFFPRPRIITFFPEYPYRKLLWKSNKFFFSHEERLRRNPVGVPTAPKPSNFTPKRALIHNDIEVCVCLTPSVQTCCLGLTGTPCSRTKVVTWTKNFPV